MNYSDKPTKKQLRNMKALYTEDDIEQFEKRVDEQVQIIREVVDTNGNPMRVGNAVTAIFAMALNETSRMLAAFDENAFNKALAAGSTFDPQSMTPDDPMTQLFQRMNKASKDFAFGHTYNRMNKVLDNATAWISHFMYSHPEYNEALEKAWQDERARQDAAHQH